MGVLLFGRVWKIFWFVFGDCGEFGDNCLGLLLEGIFDDNNDVNVNVGDNYDEIEWNMDKVNNKKILFCFFIIYWKSFWF